MKKLFLTFMCIVSGIAAMAQSQGTNRLVVHKGDNTIVGYAINNVDSVTFDAIGEVKAALSVVSTEESSMTINIQRTADCKTYYLAYEIASNWDGYGTVADRIKEINHTTYSVDGNQQLQSLHSGETYNVYTLGFDKYGIEGEAQMVTVKVGTGEEDMFDIVVNNITSSSVSVKITPKDQNMYYSWMLHTKEHYDEAIEKNGDMNGYDNAWWNWVATQYGTTWEEAMRNEIVQGVTDIPKSDWLLWDSDYVVTVYGIDYNDGSALTKTMVVPFHTLVPEPSDNQISVEIKNVYSDGVDVKITTTNNDTYLVGSESASYVNFYQQNGNFLQKWISDVHENASLLHNGDDEFKKTVKKADTDYYLIVVGYDGGPTTEVQLIPFHTAAQ